MKIRAYDADKDFGAISTWITDERTHAMWCANLTAFPLQRESFDKLLTDISERFGDRPFVAVDDEENVEGFFCFSLDQTTNEGMFKFVMVDPNKRGKGLGKQMISLAVKRVFEHTKADAVQLNVFTENPRARRCYEGAGFRERKTDVGAFRYGDEAWGRCNMVITR